MFIFVFIGQTTANQNQFPRYSEDTTEAVQESSEAPHQHPPQREAQGSTETTQGGADEEDGSACTAVREDN